LLIAVDDGAASIGPIAVALGSVTRVRHLTLRTPTLDDVFLELTGNRIERVASDNSVGDIPDGEEILEVG
jgi:ABC-2 type transport system ATP-binding protein